MKKFSRAAFVSMVLAAPLAFADGALVNPGQWEMTVKFDLANMPPQMPKEHVTSRCVTADQVKTPEQIVQNLGHHRPGSADDCVAKDVKVGGKKLSFTLQCSKGTAKGEGTFGGGEYHMALVMDMIDPRGIPMKGNIDISGKRVGECAAQ